MNPEAYPEFRRRLFDRLWREVAPMEREIEETERIPRDHLAPILADLRVFELLVPERHAASV
jgi:hypothetical protein